MELTWAEFQEEIEALARKIDSKSDAIVGIVRGGIVPARLLSSKFDTSQMYCLSVAKVGVAARKLTTQILDDLNGKTVLLVEDVLETGQSLIVAKKYLEEKGAKVKTACLYTMPKSEIIPDYFLRKIKQAVTFPWEK